ncbi:probable WRKY transcription factor 41 [Juglans microcarpa x Juglans regia]|uniref:probable WRKY transcription factor 41 n=1 Tax=Juglans microcarpa x Juglans regia TaxID=2249226 RepID=UPI001B7D93FC|nr:probable WRKY transcription factor 41 [Juglans microcarpa x Juglans regia]
MEKSWSWEQKTLVSELIQGMEMAKQLRVQFSANSSSETTETLLHRILASYEKALMILRWSGSMGQTQTAAGVTTGVPGSPISVNGSFGSNEFDKGLKDHRDLNDVSKKRKIMPRWTDQVRVSSETGLEGPHDDGYSWRKYGQKDILGAKYPRSYYRCTFRLTQNCWATKQVQRADEDPNVFEITYRGRHICSHATNLVPAPSSPEKQEQKQNFNNNDNQQDQRPLDILGNIGSSLRIVTEELENKEMSYPFSFPSTSFGCTKSENSNFSLSTLVNNTSFMGSFSPPFLSPATPESNFHSVSPFQNSNFKGAHNVHRSESDLTEIISANTSATSSPILDLDFSLDPAEIGHFPFSSAFFT